MTEVMTTAIATVAAATVTVAKKKQSTKSCSGKNGDDGGSRGERREVARAARAASIHKKTQTRARLVLVTRHNHIEEIVPQIVPRIVPEETSSKNAIFFGGFRYYFGTICGTGNSTQNSTNIILQKNGPKAGANRRRKLFFHCL